MSVPAPTHKRRRQIGIHRQGAATAVDMKRWIVRLLAASLGLAAMGGLAAELGWKKSTRHAVTVTVIPGSIEPGADAWEFLVAFHSHWRSHLQTLPDRAMLVGPHGSVEAAIEWEQLPPAPFQRQGAVRFKPIAPFPKTIELRVKLFGEHGPRAFRWRLQQRGAGAHPS